MVFAWLGLVICDQRPCVSSDLTATCNFDSGLSQVRRDIDPSHGCLEIANGDSGFTSGSIFD